MPNLLQRFAGWFAEAAGAMPRDLEDPRFWGMPILVTEAGVSMSSDAGLQLGVVQSVMSRLGGTLSTLPLMVFERIGPDGQDKRAAREHRLYQLLRRPNSRQTAQEFRDEQERHLAWWRNAYSIIHPATDGYPIGWLEQVHPDRVFHVQRARDGWVYYSITRLAPETGWETYREDEIWHLRRAPLTKDGLRGAPVWETARETLGRALAVERFGARFFKNGVTAGGVIEHPGTFKDKEAERAFMSAWRESAAGTSQNGDRLLLHGVKYNRPTLQNDHAQFLETFREMGYRTAALWNMPGHMVGLMDRATFNNIEQQSTEYAVHCISPDVTCIEEGADRDLLIGDDQDRFFCEYNLAGLLRGDFKTRYQGYNWGRLGGWLSANDIRRMENMDPIGPAGDIYLAPLNTTPAGSAQGEDPAHANPQDPEEVEDEANAA